MPEPSDGSNGYDANARAFMDARSAVIGVASVRAWARAFAPGSAVLDLGCGHGVPLSQILVEAGLSVFGIDASPVLLAAFRARFPHAAGACEAVEHSPFFDRQFDGALAWGLIFLLPAAAQPPLIHKVAGALTPGGRFLFTAPREACSWSDSLTGRESISLGSGAYARILGEAGLVLVAEHEDEGDNHYYSASKP